MSKCIDCLHYEACKGTYYTAKGCDNIALYDFDGEMYADSGCEDFTDRSEWVHLPCKVGDKVWYITGIGNNLIKPAIVKEIIIDGKGIKDLYVCDNGHNFERSFDIFYLTYKEAEKALEEMKSE
jgi:hypothetical protein